MTSDENAGDLLEVAILNSLFHFAKALDGKSFLIRTDRGESIANFLCESESLKKQYRKRRIGGNGECATSHADFLSESEAWAESLPSGF